MDFFKKEIEILKGVTMEYDLKKVEDKFYEFLEKLFPDNPYERDEIKLTEELLEQENALYIPFGFISYFLVIDEEKPILYVNIATRMGINSIGFIDENGDEGYDISDGDHKDIMEKFANHSDVKKFKDLKVPRKMKNRRK